MDTLKTGFTYVIALVVLIGSGALLYIAPENRFEQLLPFVTAVDGAVIAYVFAREQTQIVQAGNGLERAELSSLRADLHSLALNAAPPPTAPITAEQVEVSGDEVTVTGRDQ